MGVSVALLGTKGGPAIRPGSTMPTSSLITINQQRIVLDCGLGVTRGLVDQGMQLRELSQIFITHLHSDHYLELGPLIHTAWVAGLKTPIEIWGPEGMDEYWQSFLQSMKADIAIRIEDEGRSALDELVSVHTVQAGAILELPWVKVYAERSVHPPLIDCFSYRFETGGKKIVFSGDTAPYPQQIEFARHADLLVHEVMLESALPALLKRIGNGDRLMQHWRNSHTFAADAGKTATRAGVKRLALNHLIPSDDPAYTEKHWHDAITPHWQGPLFVGHDGLRIDLV